MRLKCIVAVIYGERYGYKYARIDVLFQPSELVLDRNYSVRDFVLFGNY